LISIPLNNHHTRRGMVQRLKIDTVRAVLSSRCFHLADHCSSNFSEFKLSTTLIRCNSAYSTLANMETFGEATSTLSFAPLFFYCEVRPPPSSNREHNARLLALQSREDHGAQTPYPTDCNASTLAPPLKGGRHGKPFIANEMGSKVEYNKREAGERLPHMTSKIMFRTSWSVGC
jgi:hypothetical protein